MTRCFYDLMVFIHVLSSQNAFRQIRKLGFSGVGAAVSAKNLIEQPSEILKRLNELRDSGKLEDVDVVTRLAIDTHVETGFLKRLLQKWRRRVEIISVHALSRELTALACRDTRIDIVTLVPGARVFKGDIWYMKEYGKRLELLLNPLQEADIVSRSKALAYYSTIINLVDKKSELQQSLIFSSGAMNICQLRDPRALVSLLKFLGLSTNASLDTVSTNVLKLVSECRDKLSGIVPVRGVRIISREDMPGSV
ncbi:MAG: RNase P subunit p30 family protein [Thermofilaceae archaeon]|nr:RNase P subunit p30 family protein [Thermofilaceae archaeon]MDW8003754.1 RNase P subunit p30 family protein [Thermofilaceae archaeon]